MSVNHESELSAGLETRARSDTHLADEVETQTRLDQSKPALPDTSKAYGRPFSAKVDSYGISIMLAIRCSSA